MWRLLCAPTVSKILIIEMCLSVPLTVVGIDWQQRNFEKLLIWFLYVARLCNILYWNMNFKLVRNDAFIKYFKVKISNIYISLHISENPFPCANVIRTLKNEKGFSRNKIPRFIRTLFSLYSVHASILWVLYIQCIRHDDDVIVCVCASVFYIENIQTFMRDDLHHFPPLAYHHTYINLHRNFENKQYTKIL